MFRNRFLLKYRALPKPVKASLWFTACYVIQRGLQFLSMPVYTRMISAEEYGTYSVFLSWHSILCIVSSLCIHNGIFNQAMIRYEDRREQYVSSVQWLTLLTGCLVSSLILGNSRRIAAFTGFSPGMLVLLCIHMTLFPSLQYWSQGQRFCFAYRPLTAVTLISALASLLLGILLVTVSERKSLALIAGAVIVQAAVNAGLFLHLACRGKCGYQKEFWKWSVVHALPLVPHYLSETVLGHCDRLMIRYMVGASQAGIYNIVYQISMVMTILRTGINGAFIPWFYQSCSRKEYGRINRMIPLLTVGMALLTVFLMLLGPDLLQLAAPESYYEAVTAMPAIMTGGFFVFVYVMFQNVQVYYGRNRFVFLPSVCAAVANGILNAVCIRRFGYLAAGYTTMVSFQLMAALHWLAVRKIAGKHGEVSCLFEGRMLLGVSAGVTAAGICLPVLYGYPLLRRGILLGLVLLVCGKRKGIVDLWRQEPSDR